MHERYRPLGLSLAILASFLFFGFVPLIPALFVLLLRLQGHVFMPVFGWFWIPPLIGAAVIILCVFAWVGRPARVRLMFMLIVTLSAAASAYIVLRPDQMNFVSELSGGSLDSLLGGILRCLIPLQLLALVYTLWYLNRAPSRAFFESR